MDFAIPQRRLCDLISLSLVQNEATFPQRNRVLQLHFLKSSTYKVTKGPSNQAHLFSPSLFLKHPLFNYVPSDPRDYPLALGSESWPVRFPPHGLNDRDWIRRFSSSLQASSARNMRAEIRREKLLVSWFSQEVLIDSCCIFVPRSVAGVKLPLFWRNPEETHWHCCSGYVDVSPDTHIFVSIPIEWWLPPYKALFWLHDHFYGCIGYIPWSFLPWLTSSNWRFIMKPKAALTTV